MSIFQIFILATAGYDHYEFLHQEYSKDIIQIRYLVSWGIKIVGIILGIGILKLNDFSRILALLNSLFIISTVNLKHSFAAYSLHTKYLDETMLKINGGIPLDFTFSSLTNISLGFQRLIDVIFGLLLIYYFTRPKVREQFKKKSHRPDGSFLN